MNYWIRQVAFENQPSKDITVRLRIQLFPSSDSLVGKMKMIGEVAGLKRCIQGLCVPVGIHNDAGRDSSRMSSSFLSHNIFALNFFHVGECLSPSCHGTITLLGVRDLIYAVWVKHEMRS